MTRRSKTVGHEILSPDGEIVAWTVDAAWAQVIVALLNKADDEGLHHYLRRSECEVRPPSP